MNTPNVHKGYFSGSNMPLNPFSNFRNRNSANRDMVFLSRSLPGWHQELLSKFLINNQAYKQWERSDKKSPKIIIYGKIRQKSRQTKHRKPSSPESWLKGIQPTDPNRRFHNGVGLSIGGVLVHRKLSHADILLILRYDILSHCLILSKITNIINNIIYSYFWVTIYDTVFNVNAIVTDRYQMNHITTVRDLGGLVKAQRKRLKLNQKALAGLVGVGNRFIVELERGKETIEFGKTLHVLRMLGISLTAESIKDD